MGAALMELDLSMSVAPKSYVPSAGATKQSMGLSNAARSLKSLCFSQPIFAPQKDVWSAAKYPSAARKLPCSSSVSPAVRLTLLSPDIVVSILDGEQGPGATLARLLEPFPVRWEEQRNASTLPT